MFTTRSSAVVSAAATRAMRSCRPSPSPRPSTARSSSIWTREEDTRQDKFRPHAVVAFKAGCRLRRHADRMVDARRHLVDQRVGWPADSLPTGSSRMAVAGLARQRLQRAEHARRGSRSRTHIMPVWFWRAPGANQHVFAIEGFLDEIASASGLDPYQVRRKLLAGKPDWLQCAGYRRREGRLGQAAAAWPRPRHRHVPGRRIACARRSPRSRFGQTVR